jgi:hypothetical protein
MFRSTAFGSLSEKNKTRDRVALFLKYDDGWRVAD